MASSMSTQIGVRCPAVEKLASPQQAPGKLHDETWAGILQKQGLRISQEVEIAPGCAAVVARPSCPDHSPEPPGPGRIIRNIRADRGNVTLHANLGCAPHAWDTARNAQTSLTRGTDTVARGRGVCEPGRTKPLSTSTLASCCGRVRSFYSRRWEVCMMRRGQVALGASA